MFKFSKLKEAVGGFITGFQQGSLHLPFVQPNALIIDRKTWCRGQPSTLLGKKGRCCLGFYCRFLGVPDEQMDGMGNPTRFPYGTSGWNIINKNWLSAPEHKGKDQFSLWTSSDNILLARYNDCKVGERPYPNEEVMIEEIRERKVAEIFQRNGVKVVFVN